MPRGAHSDAPLLNIGPVLIHYGARSLPGGVGWRTMRCPFPEHNDSQSSARVNIELGGFICLACGISGDAIKIIRDREGLSFGESIEFARKVFGASVSTISPGVRKSEKRKRIGRHKWSEVFD
jgi:DNA primase